VGTVNIPKVDTQPDKTWVGRHVDINGHFIANQKGGYIVVSVIPSRHALVPGGRSTHYKWTDASLTIKLPNGKTKIITVPHTPKGDPNVTSWISALKKAKQKQQTNSGTDSGSTTNNPIISITDVVKGKIGKFNPPPHNSSRPTSPLIFPSNLGGHSAERVSDLNTRIKTAEKFNNRGFIYEDIDSAQDVDHKPKARKNLWGFEFMYNPTTISHTLSLSPNTDYTNPLDVANQLTGSQMFSITILLNRVTDMSALHKRTGAGTAQGYPRALTSAEVKGIQTRGTEYDLEFLYRVVNGDPSEVPGKTSASSDFGFISGIPIWIRLNNQMRYKGLLAGISVTHTMFTPSMVPIMSEVSLQFLRIPVMSYGDNGGAISDRYTTHNGKTSRIPKYGGSDTPTSGG